MYHYYYSTADGHWKKRKIFFVWKSPGTAVILQWAKEKLNEGNYSTDKAQVNIWLP